MWEKAELKKDHLMAQTMSEVMARWETAWLKEINQKLQQSLSTTTRVHNQIVYGESYGWNDFVHVFKVSQITPS